MKQTLVLLFLSFMTSISAQNFEMNHDTETEFISYQGVIETDSLTVEKLLAVSDEWQAKGKFDIQLVSEEQEKGYKEFEVLYKTVGKSSEFGKAYNYRLTSKLRMEFKDQKMRYTFTEFTKKSSPGEPGLTLEKYQEWYINEANSNKAREKAGYRLDEIELELHEQVSAIIFDMKKSFKTQNEAW